MKTMTPLALVVTQLRLAIVAAPLVMKENVSKTHPVKVIRELVLAM
jgi:hypothetical protein